MMYKRFPALFLLSGLFACTPVSPEQTQDVPVPVMKLQDAGFSRTTTNPKTYAVEWADGDAVSVFNAPAGTTAWSGNLKFVTNNASGGVFYPAQGVKTPFADGVAYDWTAVYPWTDGLAYGELPAIPSHQVQNGKNNTDHLSAYDVLYGEASSTREPDMLMHHAGTLLRWNVRNDTELPFTVESIRFDNGSSEYTLSVTGQAEIAPSYSAGFYMLADPFSFKAGDRLEVAVTTSVGTETQVKLFPSAMNFASGCYNTATIVCNPTESPTGFKVAKNSSGLWRVYKGGEEFFMNGAAANNFYDKLADFGGNVIRTYGTAQIEAALAAAKASGIYVLVGLPVGREREGFDFDDSAAIAAQQTYIEGIVSTYASHPSVLGWIIGNELDSSYSDSRVWSVVEDIASAIKAIDPYHLTTTALAGAKQSAVTQIKSLAPSLDFLSFNSYYPTVLSLQSNLASYGWTKPWAVTEFGPRGTWGLSTSTDPPATSWGACVEQTSTQKARIYRDIMADAIKVNKDKGCIGSFAFVWGYLTSGEVRTWYGLFDTEGFSYGAVDELQYAWTGEYPACLAPVINNRHAMLIDNSLIGDDNVTLDAGSAHAASVTATSPCGAPLTYTWAVYAEGDAGSNGSSPGISGLIEDATKASITFAAPPSAGNYRLVVFVKDRVNSKAAMASCPFTVPSGSVGISADKWNSGNTNW